MACSRGALKACAHLTDRPALLPVLSCQQPACPIPETASTLTCGLQDVKGRVIVHRDYRGDVSPKVAERFMNKLNELEEVSGIAPIICDEGVTYIYTQVSNLYVLAVTRSNVNAASVVVFLHRLIGVFKHYFQVGTQPGPAGSFRAT